MPLTKKGLSEFMDKYENTIKYSLFIANIFFMLSLIKIYNNYSILSTTIANEEQKNINLEQQIAYSKNFVEPYVVSPYASYFLAHENARFFKNELLIAFRDEEFVISEQSGSLSGSGSLLPIKDREYTPSEQRNFLLNNKRDRIKNNFLF